MYWTQCFIRVCSPGYNSIHCSVRKIKCLPFIPACHSLRYLCFSKGQAKVHTTWNQQDPNIFYSCLKCMKGIVLCKSTSNGLVRGLKSPHDCMLYTYTGEPYSFSPFLSPSLSISLSPTQTHTYADTRSHTNTPHSTKLTCTHSYDSHRHICIYNVLSVSF